MFPTRTLPGDDEIDLFAIVGRIASRWYLIAAGLGAGIVGGFLYSSLAQPLYRATMKLLVVPASLEERRQVGAVADTQLAYRYLPFLRNGDVLREAAKEAKLDGPADAWKIAGLSQHLSPVVSKEAPILELSLDLPEADAAQRMLTAIANQAITLNAKMLSESDIETRQFLKTQLDSAAEQLAKREESQQQFNRDAHIEQRRKEADSLLDEAKRLEGKLNDSRMRESQLTGAVAAMAQSLASQQKVLSLRRSVADDPGASAVTNANPGTALTVDTINPVYERMEPELVRRRSDLAGATAQTARLRSDLNDIQARARKILSGLAQETQTAERMKMDTELARGQYKTLFERYESARIVVAAQSAALRVFEQPTVGSRPVSPRLFQAIVFGAVLGVLLGVVAAAVAALFLTGAASTVGSRAAVDGARV